jgi:hypothetical protein
MRGEADGLVELACQTGLQGGGAWDDLLGKWGVEPLLPDERVRHATVGPARSAGPPPIELRRVGEALADYIEQQMREFDRKNDPPMDVDQRMDRLRFEARELPADMLKKFLARVRPKTTTASIFANARNAKRHVAGDAGPRLSTLACHACGAPRQQGATSRTCEFCGTTF